MSVWRPAGFSIAAALRAKRGQPPAQDDAALPLLADRLRAALASVAPAASFRQELGRELAAVARERRAPRVVLQRPRNYRRGILIGAAAVSSAVSVAGLVALIWHHRAQQMSPAHRESMARAA